LVVPPEGHLLGDGEIVLLRFPPVDEVDGFRRLTRLGLHRHAVAQKLVDFLVVAVERAAVVVRLGAELVEGGADLRRRVAAPGQPCREQLLLDVAVAVAVGPVTEIAVAQLVAEQGDDAVLGGALGLADEGHFRTSQYPDLVAPTWRITPAAFILSKWYLMPLSLMPSLFASSLRVIEGWARNNASTFSWVVSWAGPAISWVVPVVSWVVSWVVPAISWVVRVVSWVVIRVVPLPGSRVATCRCAKLVRKVSIRPAMSKS